MTDIFVDHFFCAIGFLVLCLIAAILVFISRRRVQRIKKINDALEQENSLLSSYKDIPEAHALAKQTLENANAMYQSAEQRSKEIIQNAQAQSAVIMEECKAKSKEQEAEAQKIIEKAVQQSKEMIGDSKAKAKKQEIETQKVMESAARQSKEIIDLANKKAGEIADKAYLAVEKADLYEKTVRAMKNIIDGYGNQYVIPSHSLLDDLAEEFSFTDAGRELKVARDFVRSMSRNGAAASCDYVEDNRRKTAIEFVIDAFNGKVDSILSRVKHDNAGTLSQEIRDSFALVNSNGNAFRNARITEIYCEARLNELKWAAVVQQLKLNEREEQRLIRERMREEEKVRRECAKAMKEAEKEEDTLRKLMIQAQERIDKATVEQKAAYEARLAELAEKLKEAEERGQRALSMAQQTRRGHVYIISNVGSFGENVYKIGLTRRLDPLDRVRELGDSSVPFEFDVHAMILSDDAPKLECDLHKHFVLSQVNKVNFRKEFFRLPLTEIRKNIEELGLEVRWTMAATAAEYRETLAIEKILREDPKRRDMWMTRQLELDAADFEMEEEVAVLDS
ncbi:MAG TPA: DUF4041 domain-containing protein [Candidatus Sumerlaeota bacterium]|nr:DUF4041 domain-containing protein [Candidatus Sumerlaeota bacterium]HPS00435.1 DUF4041 domain-containing protein [Candidatus Sumerlaeota bacterium]